MEKNKISLDEWKQTVEEVNGCRRALAVYFNDSEYAVNTVERLIAAKIKLAISEIADKKQIWERVVEDARL